ncbi:MAG TPA: NADP-dependent oxidoreductase [Ktedonobacterales bacterium]|jgi:NADPH:quinone reductase-like Zn-dependent oxidoreductase
MRAILLTAFGSAEHFCLAELQRPEPQPGEVRIRIHAAAFNPTDYQRRQGAGTTNALPLILGIDVAGTVDAVGSGVTAFAVGDEVYTYLLGGGKTGGGYAEYVCRLVDFVAHKPQNLSFGQAAAVVTTGLTAYQCLEQAPLHPGEPIFVAGGSGGVGTMMIHLARRAGAGPIFTVAGSERSARYLSETLGIPREQILFYAGLRRAQLAERLRALSGGRLFRIAIDCVGGAMTGLCCDAVDFEGHVISIVQGPRDDSHAPEEDDENRLFNRSAAFHFVMASVRGTFGDPETWSMYGRQLAALTELFENGAIPPPTITEVGDLSVETVRQAHALLETGHVQGKLVMRVE